MPRQAGKVFIVAAALAVASACGRPARPPLQTAPAFRNPTRPLTIPPELEDRLLYYNGFDVADARNPGGLERVGLVPVVAEGLFGQGALTGDGRALVLRGESLSPHRPLTVSFWWSLVEDARLETGFGLVHLGGRRGYIAHFCRGRGSWCGLQRPAAVLQVYYIPGIKNVNGIYDFDLLAHLDLRRGKWHHTALVVRGASLVEVYTDGRRAWGVRVRGRRFRPDDGLTELVVGTRWGAKMLVDEVVVLRRALTPQEIAHYYQAIQQIRQAGHLDATDNPDSRENETADERR